MPDQSPRLTVPIHHYYYYITSCFPFYQVLVYLFPFWGLQVVGLNSTPTTTTYLGIKLLLMLLLVCADGPFLFFPHATLQS
jgi:hypothetical protein